MYACMYVCMSARVGPLLSGIEGDGSTFCHFEFDIYLPNGVTGIDRLLSSRQYKSSKSVVPTTCKKRCPYKMQKAVSCVEENNAAPTNCAEEKELAGTSSSVPL